MECLKAFFVAEKRELPHHRLCSSCRSSEKVLQRCLRKKKGGTFQLQAVADPGFESRGGGAWNSKTPKLVIATRSRRGPALAPSRGSGGMLPREILKIGMRRYAFFTILGYNFRKIRERICKVICTYIYNFYKIFEVSGKIKKRCST